MVKRIAVGILLLSFLISGAFLASGPAAYAKDSKKKTKVAKTPKATPTNTGTLTKTATPKKTATPTKTQTFTRTFTSTKTPVFTKTPTFTRTFTATPAPKRKVEMPPLFLAEVKGDVYLVHKGDKKKADPPQKVEQDDRIITSDNGKAYLEFASGGTIEVGSKSDVKVSKLDITPNTFKTKFQIAVGKMKTAIHKLTSASSSFEVEAGGVVSGVRGTTFEVGYDKDKKQASTKTYDGTVYTLVNGKETLVEKGFSLMVGSGGGAVLGPLTGSDVTDFVDFLGASDKLEKGKEILLKKLEQRLLDEVAKQLLGGAGKDLGKALQFHF